ncbi:MAG: hypothetical protein LCH67_18005 [Bacteroidetes bacterium]|nr:hypothetical protein [Bacteroidota bacterium]
MKEDFEQQWSDALGNYSVPPPDDAWANIEARLDEKSKKRGLILWWTNPRLISGVAAALVLSLGYLFYNKLPNQNDVLAEQKEKGSVKQPSLNKTGESRNDIENQVTVGGAKKTQTIFAKNKTFQNLKSIVSNNSKYEVLTQSALQNIEEKSAENLAMVTSMQLANNSVEEIKNEKLNLEKTGVDKLQPQKMRTYANRFVFGRNKLAYEMPEEELVAKNTDKKHKIWLGLNSGAAPFNPNYSYSGFTGEALTSAKNDVAFQEVSNSNVQASFLPSGNGTTGRYNQNNSMPENTFKNGQAYNLGLNFGKNLSKNFGIESGIRYLRANTSMNSNVFAIDPKNGNVSSYFQANYLSSGNNANFQTVLSLSETSQQYYHYVAVPLVLNYSVPLVKNLNIEALGGFSNDFFIKTKFESLATGESTLGPSNSNYKLFNISGLGGARLNYNLFRNWGLSVGGMYQHAIFSGTGQNTSLKFKPQSFGLNYGLRYQF